MSRPDPLAKLVEQLQRLPGIGAKSAQRLAFHVLKTPREEVERLADAMREVKERVTYCSVCSNITDVDPCYFCTHDGRDKKLICVVEEPENVIPGRNRYYASAMTQDGYATGVLIAHQMARPIKVEGNPDHPATEPCDGLELDFRRSLRRHHRTGDAQLARSPGNALRHVPGGRREYAAPQLGRRKLSHGISRAANLERADRLEVFQLQVNLCRKVKTVQPDEWRAQRRSGRPPARIFNGRESD